MRKTIKNQLRNFLKILLIFLLIFSWLFFGFSPRFQKVEAAISFVGAGAQVATAASNSLTPSLPSGVQAGDLLIAIVANREDSPEPTFTFPSGWTQRGSVFYDIGNTGLKLETWWKFAGESESNPTITTNTYGAGWSAQIAAYRGIDSSNPWDIASPQTGQSAAARTWTPPDVTTQTENAWSISVVMTSDNNALNFNNANGHTARMSGANYDTTAGVDHSIGLSDKEVSSPGSAGMPTWNQSANYSDSWVGISDALRRAPVLTIGTAGNQVSSLSFPSNNNYLGGAFTLIRNSGITNVTQITITETGTINANLNLSNVKLYYETTDNCSYDGTENLFGTAPSFNSFEKATVSGTMSVGTFQVCLYVVLDVGSGASVGQTIEIEISNPSTEVIVSAGSVSPATPVAIAGSTTLQFPSATWRAAENATTSINKNEKIRLRIALANSGSEATDYDFLLEYALKNGDFCGDDESFVILPVTASTEHFEMAESIYFSNGDQTTPRLSNPEGYDFVPGRMVEDPSNSSGNITLPFENYTEIEFVFFANDNAIEGQNYCFRVTKAGIPLDNYPVYPELQISSP